MAMGKMDAASSVSVLRRSLLVRGDRGGDKGSVPSAPSAPNGGFGVSTRAMAPLAGGSSGDTPRAGKRGIVVCPTGGLEGEKKKTTTARLLCRVKHRQTKGSGRDQERMPMAYGRRTGSAVWFFYVDCLVVLCVFLRADPALGLDGLHSPGRSQERAVRVLSWHTGECLVLRFRTTYGVCL